MTIPKLYAIIKAQRERIMEDKKMEHFEWMDTLLTELADWEAFEADLAEGDPWAE